MVIEAMSERNLLTIIIPQHREKEAQLFRVLTSINNQVGIDLTTVAIKIIGDGGYRISEDFFDNFKFLDINYVYYYPAHGPGYARQIGLEQTRSKYLAYLDADDTLSNVNSLWQFVNVLRETGDHQVIFSRYIEERSPQTLLDERYIIRDFNPSAVYGKWLNVDYLRAYAFYWHPKLQHAYEDTFFLDSVLTFATDIYYLDIPTYMWLYHNDSIVRTNVDYNSNCLDQYVLESRLWIQEMEKRAPQRLKFDINNGLANIYIFYIQHPPVAAIERKFQEEIKEYVRENKDYIDLSYSQKLFNSKSFSTSLSKFIAFWQPYLSDNCGLQVKKHSKNQSKKMLSLVIPFRENSVTVLKRLFWSIINQVKVDLKQLEVIIVQDGGNKIDETAFKQCFPQLDQEWFYHKDVLGPGPSRSQGLQKAQGKYVMFCDADDQLHTITSLYNMCRAAKIHPDADILMAKYMNEQFDSEGQGELVEWSYNFGAVYPHWFNLNFLRSHRIDFHHALHSYYEDTFFCGIATRVAKNIIFTDEVVYTHRFNPYSLIHKELKKRQALFLEEYCRENYYWFQVARQRFPQKIRNDLNNFIITLYYMYTDYRLDSFKIDSQISYWTHKIKDHNSGDWHGWTPMIQQQANDRHTDDAIGVSSQGLKMFIEKFMTK